MNIMLRTIKGPISSSYKLQHDISNKKLFQIVKCVTGKSKSDHTDYNVQIDDNHYGYDQVTISGRLGFITVTLEPLFQEI